jgi:hypothetical protein
MFTREFLVDVRRSALRRGLWTRVLDGIERGIVTLASRLVDTVVNATLGVVLVKILQKLRDASRSAFAKHVDNYGWRRAFEVKVQLEKLGYILGDGLERDLNFAKYLAFLDFYRPKGWGAQSS